MSFERRHLGQGAYALVPASLERAGFLAVFTERPGGASEAPFDSLNLSYSVGDDPSAVAANRQKVINGFGIPPFALGGQVHGAKIAHVDEQRSGAGFGGPVGVLPATDGLTTSARGVPVAVAVADCVPVALVSPAEETLVLFHAGWRGVAAGIIPVALSKFARTDGILAATGPAARWCHYEVGEEVVGAVSAASPNGSAATERRSGRSFLDLPRTIAAILRASGVRSIDDADICTICEADRFFSHRRDQIGGRQMAIAMRLS